MQYKGRPLKVNSMKLNETTQVNTINNEYITLIDTNGNPLRINKADLAEVIRANMPLATATEKGLIQTVSFSSYITKPNPYMGSIDFKTSIAIPTTYCCIVFDFEGIYNPNKNFCQKIQICFVVNTTGVISNPVYRSDSGNSNKYITSAILYKGTDGYLHLVVNTLRNNYSNGYFRTCISHYSSLNRNRIVSCIQSSENYVDGTNAGECKCTIA